MAEREALDIDVLFVGAGPSGLAGAYHLKRLVDEHQRKVQAGTASPSLVSVSIAVIEKSARLGDHILSGAVLDPRGLEELMPDYAQRGAPIGVPVKEDHFYFFSRSRAVRLPFTPPMLRNHGFRILSLGDLVGWLGEETRKLGVEIFTGFPGKELLLEGERVAGVRTGDKGIDKNGQRKANFEPGVDLRAKVTVLAEGPRGSLTKDLVEKFQLAKGRNPQSYATGVKEVWEIDPAKHREGRVVHTMGFPLDQDTFGGGFIYHAKDHKLFLGVVTGLDYEDPFLDPHEKFQKFKTHPYVAELLVGGKMIQYGAKAIAEGGYYAMPKLFGDGFLVVGDSASFLNSARLKGIHLGIKSGMMAAETIFEALLKNDFRATSLGGFEKRFHASWAKRELWSVRNFHQGFQRGLAPGFVHLAFQLLTGGRGLIDPMPARADHERMRRVSAFYKKKGGEVTAQKMPFDDRTTFHKTTDVFHSGTQHDEDQPAHLVVTQPDICVSRCTEEYGNPCQHFCPANVYEMVGDRAAQTLKLQINFANCVHCKTCDIKDPYAVIEWTTPEGGGGPHYVGL